MAPRLGIQLYTLREQVAPDQFRTTLAKVAELGFAGVEFAWQYGGMRPAELAGFLRDTGLVCCGLHVQLGELLDASHPVYDYALATGSSFITTSLCGQTSEFDTLCPELNQAGEIAASKKLCFTYHNHWQEFVPGAQGLPQDLLLAETDAERVQLELDLGWLRRAGIDPLPYWRAHASRTPQIHLRDYDSSQGRVCDVGDGCLVPTQVWAQACELRTQWVIYEQDTYPVSVWDSCRTCATRMVEAAQITP